MKPKTHDPGRLDVAAFAIEGAVLGGEWPGVQLKRLALSQSPPQDTPPAPVQWEVRGESRRAAAAQPEIWMHVRAHTLGWFTCQRCLQPVQQLVEADRRIRFVQDEAKAEALDAELEDDVLALPHRLDLAELVEDELLLALPIVPHHGACPRPLPVSEALVGQAQPDTAAHPFAALQAIRRRQDDGPAGTSGGS